MVTKLFTGMLVRVVLLILTVIIRRTIISPLFSVFMSRKILDQNHKGVNKPIAHQVEQLRHGIVRYRNFANGKQ